MTKRENAGVELKPCPCCESDAEYDYDLMFFEYGGHERCSEAVQCTSCGLRVEVDAEGDKCSCCNDLKLEARTLWNTRPTECAGD